VGFEHTIPDFERAKTVHALDRAATVIGGGYILFNVFACKEHRDSYVSLSGVEVHLQEFLTTELDGGELNLK
jgi:hypothetical protein